MSNAMLSYRPNRAKLPAKIIGIQFGIPSPDEIRKGSVVEITSRDTYANNKPVIGGLFDPRMGVLEPGLICPTDGLDYMQTPGYFGHLELARWNIARVLMRRICAGLLDMDGALRLIREWFIKNPIQIYGLTVSEG